MSTHRESSADLITGECNLANCGVLCGEGNNPEVFAMK